MKILDYFNIPEKFQKKEIKNGDKYFCNIYWSYVYSNINCINISIQIICQTNE